MENFEFRVLCIKILVRILDLILNPFSKYNINIHGAPDVLINLDRFYLLYVGFLTFIIIFFLFNLYFKNNKLFFLKQKSNKLICN